MPATADAATQTAEYDQRRCQLYLGKDHVHGDICVKLATYQCFDTVDLCMTTAFGRKNCSLLLNVQMDLIYSYEARRLTQLELAEYVFHTLYDFYINKIYEKSSLVQFQTQMLDLTMMSGEMASQAIHNVGGSRKFYRRWFVFLHFYMCSICYYTSLFSSAFSNEEVPASMANDLNWRFFEWITHNAYFSLQSLIRNAEKYSFFPEIDYGSVSNCISLIETIRLQGGLSSIKLPSPDSPRNCAYCAAECSDPSKMYLIDCCGFYCLNCLKNVAANDCKCLEHNREILAWTATNEIIEYRKNRKKFVRTHVAKEFPQRRKKTGPHEAMALDSSESKSGSESGSESASRSAMDLGSVPDLPSRLEPEPESSSARSGSRTNRVTEDEFLRKMRNEGLFR